MPPVCGTIDRELCVSARRRRTKSTSSLLSSLRQGMWFIMLAVLIVAAMYGGDKEEEMNDDVSKKRVGIVAGHWQSDSGAVCSDGLQEADVNLSIARKVVTLLTQREYKVQLLAEYDDGLNGYQGDAFISLHSDSCVPAGMSGFKIAAMTGSTTPEEVSQLVEFLRSAYSAATGLRWHPNTITDHMRFYHAWRKIDPGTPGAIMEMGFMGGDREILLQHQDVVAQGIADGIIAFLEPLPELTPSPHSD